MVVRLKLTRKDSEYMLGEKDVDTETMFFLFPLGKQKIKANHTTLKSVSPEITQFDIITKDITMTSVMAIHGTKEELLYFVDRLSTITKQTFNETDFMLKILKVINLLSPVNLMKIL